jgi:hypothetical protein
MRNIYFKGHKMTDEDFKVLDYEQGNYLDTICDAFYELTKEEQKKGFTYGDYLIIEQEEERC